MLALLALGLIPSDRAMPGRESCGPSKGARDSLEGQIVVFLTEAIRGISERFVTSQQRSPEMLNLLAVLGFDDGRQNGGRDFVITIVFGDATGGIIADEGGFSGNFSNFLSNGIASITASLAGQMVKPALDHDRVDAGGFVGYGGFNGGDFISVSSLIGLDHRGINGRSHRLGDTVQPVNQTGSIVGRHIFERHRRIEAISNRSFASTGVALLGRQGLDEVNLLESRHLLYPVLMKRASHLLRPRSSGKSHILRCLSNAITAKNR